MSSPSIDIVGFVLLVCLDFASLCARYIAGASSYGRREGAAMEMARVSCLKPFGIWIVGLDKTTDLRRSYVHNSL